MAEKHLAVFDFDGTVADGNTFRALRSLLDGNTLNEIKKTHLPEGREKYAREVFRILSEKGYDRKKLMETVRQIKPTPGIKELFKYLVEKLDYDLIILSDSVELFVVDWLAKNNLESYVHAIYASHGEYTDSGIISFEPANAPLTHCSTDGENHRCRGEFLKDFYKQRLINDRVKYVRTVYVGDGRADLCPLTRLVTNDLACVREGHGLHDILHDKKELIKAEVLVWNDGDEIIKNIEEICEKQGENDTN